MARGLAAILIVLLAGPCATAAGEEAIGGAAVARPTFASGRESVRACAHRFGPVDNDDFIECTKRIAGSGGQQTPKAFELGVQYEMFSEAGKAGMGARLAYAMTLDRLVVRDFDGSLARFCAYYNPEDCAEVTRSFRETKAHFDAPPGGTILLHSN